MEDCSNEGERPPPPYLLSDSRGTLDRGQSVVAARALERGARMFEKIP